MGGVLRMPRAELEVVAAAVGAALPWSTAGPVPSLGAEDPVPAAVADALRTFAGAELLVDVELVARPPTPAAPVPQVRSWQRLRGDRAAAVSVGNGDVVELAWCGVARWPELVARTLTVTAPTEGRSAQAVDVPLELLVAGCGAVRLGRPDLLTALLRRHRLLDGEGLVRRLAACEGRMRATVSARGRPGELVVGWLTWLLFADGWRALTPYTLGQTLMVRLRPVEPADLGISLLRLTGVGS